MKYVLLYKKDDKNIIIQQIMPDGTRPIYNTAIYKMAEFDTEAEMLTYIEDNNLEIVEVENGID